MNLLNNAILKVPTPVNEPVYSYAPGTPERDQLKAAVEEISNKKVEIPLIIGGKEVRTGKMGQIVMPHDHKHVLGEYHLAGEKEIQMAIDAAMAAKEDWANLRWEERAAIFLKAAELLSGKYRYIMNAVSMLSTSKSAFQAEIDAACELIDFLRFNVYYAQQVYTDQPHVFFQRPLELRSAASSRRFRLCGRPRSTSPRSPATWQRHPPSWATRSCSSRLRPVSTPLTSSCRFLKRRGCLTASSTSCRVPVRWSARPVLTTRISAAFTFTGSTGVFHQMWQTVGNNIARYKSYPRIVGETGGKDFIVAHESANVEQLTTAIIRGAFEFQGQKCSAASRAYIPKSLWGPVREKLETDMGSIKMGTTSDFRNFFNAVIDKSAFATITEFIDYAKAGCRCRSHHRWRL